MLRRAELGTPTLTVCPVCRSEHAVSHPIILLTDDGVTAEPWVLIMCPDCGRLIKVRVC